MHTPSPTDVFIHCEQGHRHWGSAGAAGLFLLSRWRGVELVLLQHRAPEVQHGDTWGIPGGALLPAEGPLEGALREAREEVAHIPSVRLLASYGDDHGAWAYTTVIARCRYFRPRPSESEFGWETGLGGLEWVPRDSLRERELHPGLAGSLEAVLQLIP